MAEQGLVAKRLTGVRSVAFVRTIFELYEQGALFVVENTPGSADHLALTIDQEIVPDDRAGWFEAPHTPLVTDTRAQIGLTSGTEGKSKGVILTHANLADTTGRLNAAMALEPSVAEYVGVPPGYSFGLARFRACAAVGGRAFIPSKGFDPSEIGRLLASGDINALSAVPTQLRVLLSNAQGIGRNGSRLRWLEIGSQYMSRHEKEQLKAIFPEAVIVQHYGLTEASRTTFLKVSNHSGHDLESVGSPVGATEVTIDEHSIIRIRGPHVARERLTASGVEPLTDADGWLTTSDLGELRDGLLFFRGRADDLINCGGTKISPDWLEEQLRQRLNIATGFAVARVPDPIRGEGILIGYEPGLPNERLRDVALELLGEAGLPGGDALRTLEVDHLPVTDTGKVRRRDLTAMAEEFDAASENVGPVAPGLPPIETMLAYYARLTRGRPLDEDDSFDSLGGDSLSYVQSSLAIERVLGELPQDWERLSVRELRRRAGKGVAAKGWLRWSTVEADIVLRCFAILFILLNHAFRTLAGGSDVLMVLAGYSWARFQRRRLTEGAAGIVFRDFLQRYVAFYLVMILAVSALNRDLQLSHLLFVSTFRGDWGGILNTYWFIESLTWCVAAVCLASAFPWMRRQVRDRPLVTGAAFVAIGVASRLAGSEVFNAGAHAFRSPDQMLIYFAVGWAAALTKGPLRAALLAIVVAFSLQAWGFHDWHPYLMATAAVVLVGIGRMRIPAALAAPVTTVAASSFYIYLFNPIPMYVTDRILHAQFGRYGWFQIAATLLGGIGMYVAIEWWVRRRSRSRALGLPQPGEQ